MGFGIASAPVLFLEIWFALYWKTHVCKTSAYVIRKCYNVIAYFINLNDNVPNIYRCSNEKLTYIINFYFYKMEKWIF